MKCKHKDVLEILGVFSCKYFWCKDCGSFRETYGIYNSPPGTYKRQYISRWKKPKNK